MIPGIVASGGTQLSPAVDLLDAAFKNASARAVFDLQPALLTVNDEQFISDTGQFTQYTDTTLGSFSVGGGSATITHSAGGMRTNIITTGPDIGMPHAFISIAVDTSAAPAVDYSLIGPGIAKSATEWVIARYDLRNNRLAIQMRNGGFSTTIAIVDGLSLVAPYRLGFSVVGIDASVWVDRGLGWRREASGALGVDLATIDLTGWKACVFAGSGGGTSWTISDFLFTRSGSAGIKDHTIVTHEDGSPYIVDGKVYFGGNGVYAYGAVYRMDLVTHEVEQTAVIMVDRGGIIQADLPPHIIRYGDGSCKLTISTWGSGPTNLRILYKETTADLLEGSHVIDSMTELALPLGGANGAYDSQMAKIGGTWYLTYTIVVSFSGNQHYAALATSPDLVTWTLVGADTSRQGYEGTKLIKDGSNYYVAIGGVVGNGVTSAVYDLSMNYLGALDAVFEGGSGPPPHPAAFYTGGEWHMVTFDLTRYQAQTYSFGKLMHMTDNAVSPEAATVSLVPFDGPDGSTNFSDSAGGSWIAEGTAQIASDAFGPYLNLDGAGGVKSEGFTSMQFGVSDFSIECDLYLPSDVPADRAIFTAFETPTNYRLEFFFGLRPDRRLMFLWSNDGLYNAGRDVQSATNVIPLATWCTVRVQRKAGVITGHVDGVQVFSVAATTDIWRDVLRRCWGQCNDGTFRLTGRIKNTRVINGRAY